MDYLITAGHICFRHTRSSAPPGSAKRILNRYHYAGLPVVLYQPDISKNTKPGKPTASPKKGYTITGRCGSGDSNDPPVV
jgi:hypothetical protein